jgi:glycosyltransferase involved in cell wall biosynthesis
MPAFDAALTIGGAITGVLWQQRVDLELIVVDDGSTDGTAAVVESIGDPRVRLIRQDHAGPAAARNRGLSDARADLVALCDADDILLPGHLNALLEVHERHDGIVTANAWLLEADGQLTRRRVRHRGRFPVSEDQRLAILQENFVSTLSLFGRELASRLGGFDESLPLAEDWDFWIRAILEGSRVSHQPRPLALDNRIGADKSTDVAGMDAAVRTVLEKAAARDDLRPEEGAYLQRRLGGESPSSRSRSAQEDLDAGRWAEAARGYREAAQLSPRNRPLRFRAAALRVAPRLVGPILRRRS